MAVRHLIDQLEAMVRGAKETPILGGARLDRDELYDVIDAILAEVGAAVEYHDDRMIQRGGGIVQPLDELDDVIHGAKTVPLTDKVRLDRDATLALIARVRSGAAQDRILSRAEVAEVQVKLMAPARRLLDRLERLVRDAKSVPLTDQARIQREAAETILAELRKRATGPLLPHVDALDAAILNAAPVPLTDEVRIERSEFLTIIQQMRGAFPQGTPPAPTN